MNEACVFVDDGISGAEFAKRPRFVGLMNPSRRPPYDALVMSEESRLGRESIEVAYALKQIIAAGVRVFFYLEDRERTLDSPMDKVMLALQTMAGEMEREKARALARAGYVSGGKCFGCSASSSGARRSWCGSRRCPKLTSPPPRRLARRRARDTAGTPAVA